MQQKLLVVDGQVFQTDARDRGMGRYSARLIRSIIDEKHYDRIQLILNKNTYSDRFHKDLLRLFPGIDIVKLDLTNTAKTRIETAVSQNKKEINKYISHLSGKKSDIDFLIPSPFQEPVVSVFPDAVKKIIVFYDLIPYLYHQRYQSLMQFDNYLKRFSLILEADKILAISQSVKDDLVVYLGIPSDRIVAIDGAAIESDEGPEEPKGIDIPEKYILMPTSDDPRKNNLRAVLGFEEFRSSQPDHYKLVITSKIHESERNRLSVFSKNLLFTGNIKDVELDWLYDHCQAVLFVPESEGLGLPILEAVVNKKRVVCSSINVFKEISDDAFYYCDHENQSSIASALTSAIVASNRSIPKEKYSAIIKHYNWAQTAKRSILAINQTVPRQTPKRPRIALFVPVPDGLSAIGKVVAEAHPILSEYFDIDYYVERGRYLDSTRPNYLQYVANYFPAESFCVERYLQYDAVLYHIGNSEYHTESIRNSLYLPGYVILHDTNIHEAYRVMNEGGMISSERRDLEELITKKSSTSLSRCISSIVNNQLGVMTHSKYAVEATSEVLVGDVPLKSVNLATNCPLMMRQRDYSTLTIGLAGIIADIKGIQVIDSLANDSVFNDCDIKLFGYNYASQDAIDRLRSYANVSVSTNLSDFDFQNSIGKLDIFVNYRMKYQGETSLSTIEAMRQGVVVIVRNVGWYSELPDDVVVKVESEEEVAQKLFELKTNSKRMMEISKNAKKFIEAEHNYKQYAEGIQALIQLSHQKKGSQPHLIERIYKSGEIKSFIDLIELYNQNSEVI